MLYINFMLSILSRTKWNDNNTSYWHTSGIFCCVRLSGPCSAFCCEAHSIQAVALRLSTACELFALHCAFCLWPWCWIVYVLCTTVASLLWPSLTEFVNGRFLPNRSRSSHRHGYGLQPRLSHPSAVQTLVIFSFPQSLTRYTFKMKWQCAIVSNNWLKKPELSEL